MRHRRVADYTWRDGLRITAGMIMLVLGVVGLVFPILQGILFLIIAAVLLAPYSRSIHRALAWLRLKFPDTHRKFRHYERKFWPRRRD